MFLHPNHRYAEIDGDMYLLTVPSVPMWKHIVEQVQQGKLELPRSFCNPDEPELSEFLITEEKGDHIEVALSWQPDNPMVYYNIAGGKHIYAEPKDTEYWPVPMQKYWPSTRYFPVRPMLIPLNKEGQIDLRLISDPNGSIVEGGSFSAGSYPGDQNPVLLHRGQKPFIVGIPNEDTVQFGDTQPDENTKLQWIVWNHCLISMESLFSTGMEGFWHSMIPWPCEAMVRINAIEIVLKDAGIIE